MMGEWIDAGVGFDEWYARVYKCSKCGGEIVGCDYRFCPHCGRPMKVGVDDEKA